MSDEMDSWTFPPIGLNVMNDDLLARDDIWVFNPSTHTVVPRDLLRRMAAVCTYGGPFTDDEAELIEGWSE